ncbi:thiamine-phosphate kinase [Aquibaculum arenosum]|uniref:Thiamine-monophosphate kinase n=1 Tax=Aquibaculum arenosum TaxID=3032591 RepID=A0ABT5YJV0_9PROT|nr:thiamine-phosphate kinase [Fodinicurvata sp. CAU 1616]MDF2095220.1 thiamine-phosphate kinase [Fodinicurvata sp. CAU 1616]
MVRGEFDQIARYFAPLAAGAPGAFGLRNDAAVLSPPPGEELVVTLDTLVEGVHFLPEDPPDLLARKALRVNLSDLAAMGARPLGYLLSTAWSSRIDDAWIEGFTNGLAADQKTFGLHLLGGDTVKTPGPLTLSITAFGSLPRGGALTRSGAKTGDGLYVSGRIGDGALGLLALRGALRHLSLSEQEQLEQAYRLPEPRCSLGPALIGLANACLDVSDGLLADAAHLAEESGLQVIIEAPAVPLSDAAQAALAEDPELFTQVLTGGDDYELAFAIPPVEEPKIAVLSQELGLSLTRVGRFAEGAGVLILDRGGRPLTLEVRGWTHF